ncbi:MAG: glycine zipper family protein [Myxococcota bacterium]
MAEVFVLALSFPSVVFTVLLGVALVYWGFVMIGVIHIGEGSEGALDGQLDAATKGVLEGAVDHLGGDHAGGDIGGHSDIDLPDGDHGGHGALAALMSALHLRSVPATVVLSLIVTFAWLISVVIMQLVTRSAPALLGVPLSLGVMALSLLLALPMTSLAAKPLAAVFTPQRAPTKSDFIGRTCVVRTGTVTSKFGEAMLHDGGAGLVLRVRVDDGKQLGRGEQALIVDYDAEREVYLVEPMRDVLAERR